MEQRHGLLADALRQKIELLELRRNEDGYRWEVRRDCWAEIEYDTRSNLFSSVGTGARGATVTIRPDRALTLHHAARAGGQFLFLTAIVLSGRRDRQELRAALCEPVTLAAKPQDRTGRDAMNRPAAVKVPGFTFPGILTEKYFRNEAEDVYRLETQQRVLVTPKAVTLRAGDLVQREDETPYTVRQVLELDPFKNEYVLERRWDA